MCSWFVIGQLFASVALNRLNASDPYNFRTPIYTQVSFHYQPELGYQTKCLVGNGWSVRDHFRGPPRVPVVAGWKGPT